MLPRKPPPALLGAQDGERTECDTEISAAKNEGSIAGYMDGRNTPRRFGSLPASLVRFKGKYPGAMERLRKDKEELLAFYDFPAEHWLHIRTTNPIESTFATVRLRTKRARNCGSRETTLAMVCY